jgi:hypothetical protein
MSCNKLEINKFRCHYKYSFDNEYFYFYWRKGKILIEEKYPLKELSSLLRYWKGYSKSTKNSFIKAPLLILASFAVYWFATDAWMLLICLLFWVVAIDILFNEIGFYLPLEYTVLSYADGDDCLYIPRDNSNESDRANFVIELKEAIEYNK